MNQNSNAPVRSKVRDTVLGGIVALVFSPIGIAIGFFLNDYLARDKLVIAHVELYPHTAKFVVSDEQRLKIKRSGIFERYRDYENLRYNSILVEAIEDGKPVDGENLDQLKYQINRLLEFTKTARADYQALREHLEKGEDFTALPESVLRSPALRLIMPIPPIKSDEELKQALSFIDVRRQDLLEFTINVSKVYADLKVFRSARTGYLDVLVVVINEGNTDGLVRGQGELVMLDSKHVVDLAAYDYKPGLSEYSPVIMRPVSKRSVTTLTYSLDSNRSRVEAIQALSAALKSNNDSRVFLRLKDTRNQPITSEVVTLPVELR